MFNLIRNLVFSVVVIAAIVAGAAMAIYGTVEPCRILAKEMSADTVNSLNELLGEGFVDDQGSAVESIFRALTSQYTSGECLQELGETWREDLEAWWRDAPQG